MLVIALTAILVKKQLTGNVYHFDRSTELLFKRRQIQRTVKSKAEKIGLLAELEVNIENHLDGIDVNLANDFADTKYRTPSPKNAI